MPDYQNSKIYKIICNISNQVYIGSTTQPNLSKRLTGHKNAYKRYIEGKNESYITSFKILEQNNYDIILIENYSCNNKDELKARERYFIENNECVNKVYPGRTQKEYQEINKEIIKEKNKEYRENNIELIREKEREYARKHKEDKKKYRLENLDKFKQYNTQKEICECGSEYNLYKKKRHEQTNKHLNYIKNKML